MAAPPSYHRSKHGSSTLTPMTLEREGSLLPLGTSMISGFSLDLHWYTTLGRGKGTLLLLPMLSFTYTEVKGLLVIPWGWKSQLPNKVSLIPPQSKGKCWGTSLHPGNDESLDSSLDFYWLWWGQCLAGVVWLLRKSICVLPDFPCLGSLPGKRSFIYWY